MVTFEYGKTCLIGGQDVSSSWASHLRTMGVSHNFTCSPT